MTRFTIKKNIVMLSLKKRHEWLPLFPVIDRIDVLSDELGIHALSPGERDTYSTKDSQRT